MNYIYILECGNGSLYTGWTNDLNKRVEQHQTGRGAKYTKAHLPVKLVYAECFATKEEAMQREWAIKQLTRTEKLRLIATHPWDPQEPCPSEPENIHSDLPSHNNESAG